jgi:hypothetical protein
VISARLRSRRNAKEVKDFIIGLRPFLKSIEKR